MHIAITYKLIGFTKQQKESYMAEHTTSGYLQEYRNIEERIKLISHKQVDFITAKWCLIATAVWMCLAHLPRWVNVNMANHDSLSIVRYDTNSAIALGRFLQPVFSILHDYISSPFLIGIASTLFLSVALYFMCKLLDLKSPMIITVLSGIFATSYVITLHSASFIFSLDSTMFAFLLAVLAVYLTARFRFGFIVATLCFTSIFALSAYYINVAVGLALVYLLKCAIDKTSLRYIIVVGIKTLGFIALGAALYLVSYPVIQDVMGVAASSYKGFDTLTDGISISSIIFSVPSACTLPFKVFLNPPEFGSRIIGFANIVLFIITIVLLVIYCQKNKLSVAHLIMTVITLVLLPLGMNCAYLIVSNTYHELFYLSYNLFYVVTLIAFNSLNILEELTRKETVLLHRRAWQGLSIVMALCFGAVLILNIIYANQVYVKKDMEAQATLSIMTRIVDKIESLDGYEPNETPVAIVGELRRNEPYSHELDGFSSFKGYGLEGAWSVTYKDTYRRYLRNLKLPMIVLPDAEINEIAVRQSTIDMPIFPHDGYCQLVDGVAIVKLSETQ